MLINWLKKYGPVVTWLQGVGVVAALIFGAVQLRNARMAIEETNVSNQIALTGRLNDLIVRINLTAIEHPEISTGYSPMQRLDLIRLEYFFEVFKLKSAGIINSDRFEAEERYLRWAGKLPGFIKTWDAVRDEYSTPFRKWVDSVLNKA